MHDKTLFVIAAIGVLVVTSILFTGIGGFARGGKFNRDHGNQMMRWRIIAQAVAIAVVFGYLALRGR